MHPNSLFRIEDRALLESLIAEIGFGQVFAQTPEGPRVAHTPIESTGDGRLRFHLSRGNALAPHLDGTTALAVLNGPDAYISPLWYADQAQVPTWNYVAIECEGPVRQLPAEDLPGHIADLVAKYEGRSPEGSRWTLDQVPQERIENLRKGIVGFEMEVRAWRPTFKLSQNKPPEERLRVADALEANGSSALAALMRQFAQ